MYNICISTEGLRRTMSLKIMYYIVCYVKLKLIDNSENLLIKTTVLIKL